jgi:hypothetical protein
MTLCKVRFVPGSTTENVFFQLKLFARCFLPLLVAYTAYVNFGRKIPLQWSDLLVGERQEYGGKGADAKAKQKM